MNSQLSQKTFELNYHNTMMLPINDPKLISGPSKYTPSLWNKKDFMDNRIRIEPYSHQAERHAIGALEEQLKQQRDGQTAKPIIYYVAVLKELRKKSQSIASLHDEMSFAHWVKNKLDGLSATLGLSTQHFNIDTGGEPLVIKEGLGEHVILPTHFENGAYLSHPHPDHQLAVTAQDIPQIKIGRYVRFGKNASVNAGGHVTIGEGVWLSPGSCLLRQDHDPYGRPSVAARTVAMTKQPPIQLADFAWVGREAMVGWDADYIGKCAIVATRSFLNSWVGDYSITGSYGKIIQYMPYKAAFVESVRPSLEDILRISDWTKLQHHWLNIYAALNAEYGRFPSRISEKLITLLASLPSKRSKVLDMNPEQGELLSLAASKSIFADGVFVESEAVAAILQRIQNTGNCTVRLKMIDPHDIPLKLPIANSTTNIFTGKSSGYDLVVNNNMKDHSTHETFMLLMEAARVANRNAKIFLSTEGDCDYQELIAYSKQIPLSLQDQGLDAETKQHYVVFSKI